MEPYHSLKIDLASKVQTIQIGIYATVVPPGAFSVQGTVARPLVIVIILCGKRLPTMITKRVASSPWRNEKIQYVSIYF